LGWTTTDVARTSWRDAVSASATERLRAILAAAQADDDAAMTDKQLDAAVIVGMCLLLGGILALTILVIQLNP